MEKEINHHSSANVESESNDLNQFFDRRKIISLAGLSVAGLLFSRKTFGQTRTNKVISPSYQKYIPIKLPDNEINVNDNQPNPKPVNMKRSPAAEAEWVRLENELQKIGISYNNQIDAKLDKHFTSIHDGFQFQAQPLDEEFVETHVEPLVDQAADLLDRCLRDRAAWDESSSKLFTLLQEIREFRSLDKIHIEEERAGIYQTPFDVSRASYEAERDYLSGLKAVRKSLDYTFQEIISEKRMDSVHNAVTANAWLGGLPAYKTKDDQAFTYLSYKLSTAATAKEAHTLYHETSHIISRYNLDLQRYNYENQLYNINAQIALSEKRFAGLAAQVTWESSNVEFQKRRTIISRDINDFKAKAVLDPNGVLNYVKRLRPLKQRFDRDFRDALARMKVIEKGLKSIYGYDFPCPKDEGAVDYYDQCLLWTRHVIQWVLKFSRNEQNTILPISLKQVLTQAQFDSVKESGSFSFELLEAHFPTMVNIRLRGLSIYVEENKEVDNRVWKVKVSPPAIGTITHYLTKRKTNFDQSFLDPCFLGRVCRRQPGKTADIVGITSLYNASPIGKWKLDLLGAIPLQEPKGIDDIIIDFQLAFRWG
jgi:hypothetical protein